MSDEAPALVDGEQQRDQGDQSAAGEPRLSDRTTAVSTVGDALSGRSYGRHELPSPACEFPSTDGESCASGPGVRDKSSVDGHCRTGRRSGSQSTSGPRPARRRSGRRRSRPLRADAVRRRAPAARMIPDDHRHDPQLSEHPDDHGEPVDPVRAVGTRGEQTAEMPPDRAEVDQLAGGEDPASPATRAGPAPRTAAATARTAGSRPCWSAGRRRSPGTPPGRSAAGGERPGSARRSRRTVKQRRSPVPASSAPSTGWPASDSTYQIEPRSPDRSELKVQKLSQLSGASHRAGRFITSHAAANAASIRPNSRIRPARRQSSNSGPSRNSG